MCVLARVAPRVLLFERRKEMPKSHVRTGLFPQLPGACRKDSISFIQDAAQRKYIASGRAAGLFDKAEQLSRLTNYRVSVIVQTTEGDLPILMFSTNDDLAGNMAELVRRFGPRLDSGGARFVRDIPVEKRLPAYLKSASDPALVIPHTCITMTSSTPRPTMNTTANTTVDEQQSTSPPLSSGFDTLLPLPFEEENFLPMGEALGVGWRRQNLNWGFALVPKKLS